MISTGQTVVLFVNWPFKIQFTIQEKHETRFSSTSDLQHELKESNTSMEEFTTEFTIKIKGVKTRKKREKFRFNNFSISVILKPWAEGDHQK